jgi:hypothetical protein
LIKDVIKDVLMQDKSASSLIKRGDGGEADLDNEDTSVDIFMLK